MPPSKTHGAAACCVIFNSQGHWRYDCKQMAPSVTQLQPNLQQPAGGDSAPALFTPLLRLYAPSALMLALNFILHFYFYFAATLQYTLNSLNCVQNTAELSLFWLKLQLLVHSKIYQQLISSKNTKVLMRWCNLQFFRVLNHSQVNIVTKWLIGRK